MPGILPHPPVFLSQIRVHDIWLLLILGGMWEFACRSVLLFLKRKSNSLRNSEDELYQLQILTAEKRKLGPQAFVETSKLERQVLILEKTVGEIQMKRKQRAEVWEKRLLRYGNIYMAILVFFLYYSIPIVSIASGSAILDNGSLESTKTFLNRLLFPLSYGGIGLRMSKWGMMPEHAESSIGALVIMWSAQVTMGKIMDGVDALVVV